MHCKTPDVILASLEQQQHHVRWQAQQTVIDGDLEREGRRIEPMNPANPDAPHRINWKHGIGF